MKKIISVGVLLFLFIFVSLVNTQTVQAAVLGQFINTTIVGSSTVGWSTEPGGCAPSVDPNQVTFYCNNSAWKHQNSGFGQIGKYQINVNGHSSNGSLAGITVMVKSKSKGSVYWTETSDTVKSFSFTIEDGTSIQEVKFILTTDTGISDTIVSRYELYYLGPVPALSPVSLDQGAYQTGYYPNLFAQYGYSQTDITNKINDAWNKLFNPNDSTNNETVYYNVGTDMAFIKDINNGDIRSEGQSYGMMIAVQMNKQSEFDRLWKFAKTYMLCPRTTQCPAGDGHDGYFSWQIRASSPYDALDVGSAPDGDEYFATALIFAANRWGNSGQFNYGADARAILDAFLNQNRANGLTSTFNYANFLVEFAPVGTAATITDPSYHLPAFYEVWSRFDNNTALITLPDGITKITHQQFWKNAADKSRQFFKSASGFTTNGTPTRTPANGLMPDCAAFDGTAIYGCAGGAIYSYDAWRAIANVAVDYNWWASDSWEITESNTLLSFFGSFGQSYANQWNLNGTSASSTYNSTGQMAENTTGALAMNDPIGWNFVESLWSLPVPTGQYRYYDGMLYLMSLLNVSGNYKIWLPLVVTDLNGDGHVNILDLKLALTNFTDIFNLNLVIANFGK